MKPCFWRREITIISLVSKYQCTSVGMSLLSLYYYIPVLLATDDMSAELFASSPLYISTSNTKINSTLQGPCPLGIMGTKRVRKSWVALLNLPSYRMKVCLLGSLIGEFATIIKVTGRNVSHVYCENSNVHSQRLYKIYARWFMQRWG